MVELTWVGIDVGAEESHVCVTDNAGSILGECQVPNDPDRIFGLISSIAAGTQVCIGMETGTFAIPLARQLRQNDCEVLLFDTYQTSRFLKIRQNKTDRNDARGIADVTRLGQGVVSASHLRTTDKQTIRSQLVMRQNVAAQKRAMEGVLGSVIRLYGGSHKRCRSVTSLRAHVASELGKFRRDGIDLSAELWPLADLCGAARAYIAGADARLSSLAADIEVCRRWMEIPGVGPLTALAFYSGIDDPKRFERTADVGGFLGLTPRIWQSGVVMRTGGITKRGDRLLRTQLVLAAGSAMRPTTADSDLKRWALAVKERRGYHRAQTGLARKLATVMLALWKSGSRFHPFTRKNEAQV